MAVEDDDARMEVTSVTYGTDTKTMVSAAISLKRIADILEEVAKDYLARVNAEIRDKRL